MQCKGLIYVRATIIPAHFSIVMAMFFPFELPRLCNFLNPGENVRKMTLATVALGVVKVVVVVVVVVIVAAAAEVVELVTISLLQIIKIE